MKRTSSLSVLLLVLILQTQVHATVIRAPTGEVLNTLGEFSFVNPPGGFELVNAFNQNGLLTGYINGVTDFDTYIASNPLHDSNATFDIDWISPDGVTSGTLVFDLGDVYTVDRLALWNEDFAGLGSLNVLTSTDNINYVSVGQNLIPTDNATNIDYAADIFNLTITNARYVRFDVSGCPQSGSLQVCGIGEFAFSTNSSSVPEPATLILLMLGLFGIGFSNRKRI